MTNYEQTMKELLENEELSDDAKAMIEPLMTKLETNTFGMTLGEVAQLAFLLGRIGVTLRIGGYDITVDVKREDEPND